MMKHFLLLFVFLMAGCSTKYVPVSFDKPFVYELETGLSKHEGFVKCMEFLAMRNFDNGQIYFSSENTGVVLGRMFSFTAANEQKVYSLVELRAYEGKVKMIMMPTSDYEVAVHKDFLKNMYVQGVMPDDLEKVYLTTLGRLEGWLKVEF